LLVRREEMPLAGLIILGRDVWSEFRSPSENAVDDPWRELPEFGASAFDWERGTAQVYDWWVRLGMPTACGRHVHGKAPAQTGALGLAVVPGDCCFLNAHGVNTLGYGEVLIDDEQGYTIFFPALRPFK
jgi:hypothetical protein